MLTHKLTKSTWFSGCPAEATSGGFCFPDINEPFAGVFSDLHKDGFVEGNLEVREFQNNVINWTSGHTGIGHSTMSRICAS